MGLSLYSYFAAVLYAADLQEKMGNAYMVTSLNTESIYTQCDLIEGYFKVKKKCFQLLTYNFATHTENHFHCWLEDQQ